jgi:S-adenosylmethionine:tRNA ribosyltransferase-isomerase
MTTKANGGRIIAVGTTVVRVLEHCAKAFDGVLGACSGKTKLMILPPYEFKIISGLITNFHLPKSTLLMLVSAFTGLEFILEAYQEAIREKYRFFSYGDAMIIL